MRDAITATLSATRPSTPRRSGPVGLAAVGLVVSVLLVPLAAGVGALVRGGAGAAGGALGASVAVVVVAVTLGVALVGARLGPQAFAGLLLGAFLLKVLVVVGLLAAVGSIDGPDRTVLGLAAVVALLVALVVEAVVSLRSRVPYVDA